MYVCKILLFGVIRGIHPHLFPSEISQDQLEAKDQKKLDDLMGKIIVPLQLACESRLYPLMSLALDCFQVGPDLTICLFFTKTINLK